VGRASVAVVVVDPASIVVVVVVALDSTSFAGSVSSPGGDSIVVVAFGKSFDRGCCSFRVFFAFGGAVPIEARIVRITVSITMKSGRTAKGSKEKRRDAGRNENRLG
jgi:hypothetical protein